MVFATDINGVLAMPGVSEELNEAYVAAYLLKKTWFWHDELTFYQSVRQLPPAHRLTIGDDSVELGKYWLPEHSADVRYRDDRQYLEAFLDLYRRAIHDRLRSVYPIGAHFSGGIDSSSIAVLASRELRRRGQSLATFSWSPPPGSHDNPSLLDERQYIQEVGEQESMKVQYQRPTPADLMAFVEPDVTRSPAESSLLQEQIVQRQAARQGIRVLLSGWGGDQAIIVKGGEYYTDLLLRGCWQSFFREIRPDPRSVVRGLAHPLWMPLKHSAKRSWRWVTGKQHGHGRHRRYIAPGFQKRMAPDARALIRSRSPIWQIRGRQLQLLGGRQLTYRLQTWANSGAKHRLVYRYPFLDRRLVEFSLGLPPEQFFQEGHNRHVQRQALNGILPSAVQWQSKNADHIRCEILKGVFLEARDMLAQALTAESVRQSRSQYMDIEHLFDCLEPTVPLDDIGPGGLWHALQFLDWK